jgi:F0F1-type ATP synthase membrane subunit c/vacuolar-type H+-ATPase subunit K
MDASQNGTVENRFIVAWIIWAAMMGSLAVYILICNVIGDDVRRPMGPDFSLALLRKIFFGLSTAALIAAHFIRKFVLRKPSGGSGPAPASQPSPQDMAARYAKYTTAMIISLALCESVGIYGLLLFFLGDGIKTLYSFMVISAAGMFYYRPKREEFEALSRGY